MTAAGQRIARMRRERKLSQGDLAGEELSASYISHIEAGRRTPTDDALRVIASRLGTTVSYLRTGSHGDAAQRAQLELTFARLAMSNGDAAIARDRLQEIDRADIDVELNEDVDLALAESFELAGQLEEATHLLRRLMLQAGRYEHWFTFLRAATMLVGCLLESGDLNTAVEVGDRAVQTAEEAGLSKTVEWVRLGSTIAWADLTRGDLLSAELRLQALLGIAGDINDAAAEGAVYWNAALVAEERGRVSDALLLAQRALARLGEESGTRDVPRLRVLYAYLLLRQRPAKPDLALAQLDLADEALQAASSSVDLAYSRAERARALLYLGRSTEATQTAQAALDLLGDEPRLATCTALLVLGDCHRGRDEDAALQLYQRASDMLALMSAGRSAARMWNEIAERFARDGAYELAVAAFQRAMAAAGYRNAFNGALDEPVREHAERQGEGTSVVK